jgi:hypothetical protein
MSHRRPDLIVPVRDRRQGKRYLTLKNFRNVTLALVVVFAVISIRSEWGSDGVSDFGRLYQSELPDVEQKPVETVSEATPVADQSHADPMLVEPMVREQWLHADTTLTATPVPMALETAERAVEAVQSGETRVAIVGGTEGVSLVKQTRTTPVLSGGFGRR